MTARVVCFECKAIHFVAENAARLRCRRCTRSLDVISSDPHPDPHRDVALCFARYSIPAQSLKFVGAYEIHDEHGSPVLFVDRPSSLHPGCFAGLMRSVVFSALVGLCALIVMDMVKQKEKEGAAIAIMCGGVFVSLWLSGVIVRALMPAKHIRVYLDPDRRHLLLDVVVVKPKELLCRDARGHLLARLHNKRKPFLFKYWICKDAEGRVLFRVREDSATMGSVRRAVGLAIDLLGNVYTQIAQFVLGKNLSLLPTNFTLRAEDDRTPLAAISRGLVAMKPYMLDLSQDEDRALDRRLALTVALVLEIGERSGKG